MRVVTIPVSDPWFGPVCPGSRFCRRCAPLWAVCRADGSLCGPAEGVFLRPLFACFAGGFMAVQYHMAFVSPAMSFSPLCVFGMCVANVFA